MIVTRELCVVIITSITPTVSFSYILVSMKQGLMPFVIEVVFCS